MQLQETAAGTAHGLNTIQRSGNDRAQGTGKVPGSSRGHGCTDNVVLLLIVVSTQRPYLYRLPQTAAWEAPPWAGVPKSGAGRHALAERGEPPAWDVERLHTSGPPTEQAAVQPAETAVKPAKIKKAEKAKVRKPLLRDVAFAPAAEADLCASAKVLDIGLSVHHVCTRRSHCQNKQVVLLLTCCWRHAACWLRAASVGS